MIDLWQVIMQEPRVANMEAELLLQPELHQTIIRQEAERQNIKDQCRIQQSNSTKQGGGIRAEKDGTRRRKLAVRLAEKKRKRKKPRIRSSIISYRKVDVII